MKKNISVIATLFFLFLSSIVLASNTTEIYISCSIASFGGYSLNGVIDAVGSQPGLNKIGYITVDGGSNEPYPWVMRVYTDNKSYQGLAGSIHGESIPSGLTRDGGGSIPLLFKTKNTGEDWVYVPDINDPKYTGYFAIRDQGQGASLPKTLVRETVICGVDPRNAAWVAGHDEILFTDDDNPYGDTTLPTPFKIELAVRIPKNIPKGKNSPNGKYSTKLIFEIIAEP